MGQTAEKTSPQRLDAKDLAILRILQADGRLTNKELAARVSLSPTPVYERVRRLEQEGFIRGYAAVLDPDKLRRGFVVFCNVKLRELSRPMAEAFVERVRAIDEVTECYNISGSFDYLLKIMAPDMAYYRDFVLNVLGTLGNISAIESTFVMASVKSGPAIPVSENLRPRSTTNVNAEAADSRAILVSGGGSVDHYVTDDTRQKRREAAGPD